MSQFRIIVVALSTLTILSSAEAQLFRRRTPRVQTQQPAAIYTPSAVQPQYINGEEVIAGTMQIVDEEPGKDESQKGEEAIDPSDKRPSTTALNNSEVLEGREEGEDVAMQMNDFAPTPPSVDVDQDSDTVAATEAEACSVCIAEPAAEAVDEIEIGKTETTSVPDVAFETAQFSEDFAGAAASTMNETESPSQFSRLRWLFWLIPVYTAWLVWMSVRSNKERYAPILDGLRSSHSS
jgi:hypothetical protein